MADAADPMHAASRGSRDAWLRSGGSLVSTDYVIDETLTLIRMRLGLRAADRWWKQIDASSRLRWEWITPSRAEKARSWLFDWDGRDVAPTMAPARPAMPGAPAACPCPYLAPWLF